MTDTEQQLESIESKRKAIQDLTIDMLACLEKATELAMRKSSPYPKVNMRRIFQIMHYTIRMRQIKIQIDMVKAMPTYSGGGLPIVGGEIKINRDAESN